MLARLSLAVVLLVLVPISRADDASIARLRKDLTYLTSDECEGRGAQTEGLKKAGHYIAAEFERLGLKPGGTNGYYQPYQMRGGKTVLGKSNELAFTSPKGDKQAQEIDKGFRPLGMSSVGSVSGPLVFAGYGITYEGASAHGSSAKNNPPANDAYDDYLGIDVAGKIVVVLRKAPSVGPDGKPFASGGRLVNELSSLNSKLMTAAKLKAKA